MFVLMARARVRRVLCVHSQHAASVREPATRVFILGARYTRLSTTCLSKQVVSVFVPVRYYQGNKVHYVGVTHCETSDPHPGDTCEAGPHHGPCADARCLFQHSWRHPVLDNARRHKDRVREIVHDVPEAVPDLTDPTEVCAARGPFKEPGLRTAHAKPCAEGDAIQFHFLRRVAGDVQHGSLILEISIIVLTIEVL